MAKPVSLKTFLNVDYTQTGDPQLAYNAKKRKRDSGEGTTEALTVQQRLARARSLRKNKAKIAIGRKRAARKFASMDVLKKRSRKAARTAIYKKLTKGIDKSELSVARRREIEKKLEKMGPRIDRIAKKLLPATRKKEKERKQAMRAGDKK
jgi:hypothetical protein